MRKVNASIFMTLDGVVEDPGGAEGFELGGWSFRYAQRSEDAMKFGGDQLLASDALLLGRKTYQGFAKAWPSMTDGGWYADRMNTLPKYVVSTTLDKAEWNNTTMLQGILKEEVATLKRQPGQDILIFGSGELVNNLIKEKLVDELRLLVHTVVLGRGRRLFKEGPPIGLTLHEAKTFTSGVALIAYRFANSGE